MTEIWMWGLIASLILLAVGTSIKAASEAVTVKRLHDDITAFRKQIESINQKFDEATQKQRELHAREKTEFIKTINELTEQITYLKAHSVPLTPDMDPRNTYEYTEAFEEASKKNESQTTS